MTNAQLGATPADWFHFDLVLGLGGHLLPCVPAQPNLKILKGSALEGKPGEPDKVGKIPSMFNREGEAHGIKDWPKREIMSAEVQQWSADPRLNICVRTGPISGVYALDVDIDDERITQRISDMLFASGDQWGQFDAAPHRTRSNSHKFLLAFRMETPCKKRKIKLDDKPKGPAIELLADGQQFVAAGSHSSGVRYQWSPDLPTELPTVTADQLNQMWLLLTETYATPASKKVNLIALGKGASSPTQSPTTSMLETTSSFAEKVADSTESFVLKDSVSESEWQDLLSALRFLLDKVSDNDTWSAIGYALLSLQGSRPAEQLWLDFSRKAVGYQPGAPEAWWEAHKSQQPRSDYRHIFTLARAQGWGRSSDPNVFDVVVPRSVSSNRDSVGASGDGSAAFESSDESEDTGKRTAAPVLDVAPPPLPEKPIVRIEAKQFSNIVTQLEEIISDEVFTQGPLLVRRSEQHEVPAIDKNKVKRDVKNAVMLVEVSREWGHKRFGEIARFERWTKTKEGGHWYETEPSFKHINNLLGLGSWKLFQPLNAIARAPFMREDGSICDTAGYDRRAGVLYLPSATYPGIPAEPNQDNAREALERIRRVFHQFPWKDATSESAFICHILSEATRLAVPTCPMFFYTAPKARIGKSTLSRMASTIVHGAVPASRTWVSDGDELRKVLFAALLAGDRTLLFDNVPTGFKTRAPELCTFITTETCNGRKLGESKSFDVVNKAVLSATGNNITPVGDMAGRAVVVRLMAKTEHIRNRRFEISDIAGYVMEHRAQLLVDALTIVKAYQQLKDTPPMPALYPSFEKWSVLAREPLIWLGLPDPCPSETSDEVDDETQSAGSAFVALAKHFGDREFTSHDLARAVGGILDTNGELITALQQSGCKDPTSPIMLQYWLREHREQINSGYMLDQTRKVSHVARWKFTPVEETLT